MTRLIHLVKTSLLNNEPVLLIGGPGSCKTTICQVKKFKISKKKYRKFLNF